MKILLMQKKVYISDNAYALPQILESKSFYIVGSNCLTLINESKVHNTLARNDGTLAIINDHILSSMVFCIFLIKYELHLT